MEESVEAEIRELESEASDPFVRQSTRHICTIKAKLLRAGYRAKEQPHDSRLINIINLKSGEIVEVVTAHQIEFARFDILTMVLEAEERRRAALEETTTTGETKHEPLTIEGLLDIWENHKIIPMIFKPTGEVVYVTPEMADFIDKHSHKSYTRNEAKSCNP